MARRDEDAATAAQAGLDEGNGAVGLLERPEAPETNGSGAAMATAEQPKRTRAKKADIDPNDPNALIGVMVRVPQGLKKAIDATAEEQSVSTPQIVVRMLAEAYSYTLPAIPTRARTKKFATEDERKAAAKEKRDADRLRVKAILSAVDNGLLGDIDVNALVEKLKAEQAAKADTATATATEGATS